MDRVTGGVSSRVEHDGKAEVLFSSPVDLEFVELADGGNEVVNVGFVSVLDAEIVNNECKGDRVGCVTEKARDVGSFVVSGGGKVSNKSLLCEEACLG